MAFRFLHTADWQLGKAFNQFGPDAGARLREARLATVRALARLAAEREVDAVLVAGDVFEHQVVSPEVVTGCLGALAEFGGDWVLLPGNHDAAEPEGVWQRVLRHRPEGARIHLATEPATVTIAGGRVAVLAAPLTRRHESADLTAAWDARPTPPGALRIGLAHGSVEGRLPEAADSANPIAPDRDARAKLDYLALGDWHGTYRISDRTWYAGTPEPDRFKNNAAGQVLLVTLGETGTPPQVEPIAVGQYRWRTWERSLASRGDIDALDRELGGEPSPQACVARLRLSGGLTLPDWQHLQDRLTWWRGNFGVLQDEQEELAVRPAEGDFAALRPPGYVAPAVAALQARQAAGDATAAHALQLLYQFCVEVGAGQ